MDIQRYRTCLFVITSVACIVSIVYLPLSYIVSYTISSLTYIRVHTHIYIRSKIALVDPQIDFHDYYMKRSQSWKLYNHFNRIYKANIFY